MDLSGSTLAIRGEVPIRIMAIVKVNIFIILLLLVACGFDASQKGEVPLFFRFADKTVDDISLDIDDLDGDFVVGDLEMDEMIYHTSVF